MQKNIDTTLHINGKNILLVGFRANKNMGDELIVLGTIKLLLEQGKNIFVVSQDTKFLEDFLFQYIEKGQITFLEELPRGVRSFFRYVFSKRIIQIRRFFQFDSIILGGGEILTEESPSSYRYRFWSIWPAFLFKKTKLYIMGGVQIPEKKKNRYFFNKIVKNTQYFYLRDYQAVIALKSSGSKNVKFFMDTSYFAQEDRTKYLAKKREKYIIVNVNSNGEKFLGNIINDILEYVKKGYKIYYVPVSYGNDDDTKYFQQIKDKLPKNIKIALLPRSNNFEKFLYTLGRAEKIIGTRLHLYLISRFIGVPTIVYPYQRKIVRMQEVLSKHNIVQDIES